MPPLFPKAFIVTYALKSNFFNYTPLVNELKKSEKWFHYIDTCWVVIRKENIGEFQQKLLGLIHKDDMLLILDARGTPAGWLPQEAWKWLNANVPR